MSLKVGTQSFNEFLKINTYAEEVCRFAGSLSQTPSPLQPYHSSGDDATGFYRVVTWLADWLRLIPAAGTIEWSVTDQRGPDGEDEKRRAGWKSFLAGRNKCGGHCDADSWGVPPQIDRGLTRTHLRFWCKLVYMVIECPELACAILSSIRLTDFEL